MVRFERTVVRRAMRGFSIDLNSSRNLRRALSLLLRGVGFGLEDW